MGPLLDPVGIYGYIDPPFFAIRYNFAQAGWTTPTPDRVLTLDPQKSTQFSNTNVHQLLYLLELIYIYNLIIYSYIYVLQLTLIDPTLL